MIEYRPGRLKNGRGVCIIASTRRTKVMWRLAVLKEGLCSCSRRLRQCTASSEAFHCIIPWLAFSIQTPRHAQLTGHSIGRLQPFPLHLTCCLSFWSVVLFYHISHRSHTASIHNPRKYHCHLCCRLLLSLVIHASHLVFGSPPFSSSSTYLFTEPNSPEWLPSHTRLSPGISWRQCPVLFLCSIHTHHVLMLSVW